MSDTNNRTRTWIKRTLAVTAVATAAFAAGAPDAAALTATASFTVNVDVFAQCTMTGAALNFPNYTTGQVGASTASTALTVSCPGAGVAPNNIPANIKLAPTNGSLVAFQMFTGANTLNYSLANGGTPYVVNTNQAVNIVSNSQAIAVDGTIAGGLSPTAALGYTQTILATLTY